MDATLPIRFIARLKPTGLTCVAHAGHAPDAYGPDAYGPDAYGPDAYGKDAYGEDPPEISDEAPIDLTAFMPLVRSIAYRIYASIPPYAAVELNDLLQSGHLGLVHAGKAYQKSRRVPFPVYARFRIRGEILDALRRLDFASRGMRRTEKLLRSLQEAQGASLNGASTAGTEPWACGSATDAAPQGAPNEHRRHLNPSRFLRLPPVAITSLDDQRPEAANWRTSLPGPDKIHSEMEARTHLDDAVRSLSPRSQELIRFYYQGGLTMREIGEHFNIKESRVSQLHRRALNCMARHLRAAGIASAGEVWELEG